MPELPAAVAVLPSEATPEYSSRAQLAGVPPDMLMVKRFEATEPPAEVDQISDRTALPLFTAVRKAQVDPLSVIELIDDEVLPKEHAMTTVLPLPLLYGIVSDVGVFDVPVFFPTPPTGVIPAGGAVG